MEKKSYHNDHLTGLAKMAEFRKVLQDKLPEYAKQNKSCAIIMLSLRRLKALNFEQGHESGDILIQTIGKRLEKLPINTKIIARFHGTNFVMMMEDINRHDAIEKIVRNILHVLNQPVTLVNEQHLPTITAGISLFPEHGADAAVLIDKAFKASFQAGQVGNGNQLVFSEGAVIHSHVSTLLENDLLIAIKNNELRLLYQLQIDATSDHVHGAEALVRWFNPRLGEISPVFFIPIAENSGFINAIGDWVLEHSCQKLSKWRMEKLVDDEFFLSINVSPLQLKEEQFHEKVISIIKKYNLPPKAIQIELTETSLMENVQASIKQLKILRDAGIKIAVDDFGTGYSSLTYLSNLPVSIVKLDRSFVSSINDAATQMVIKSVIDLAHQLNLEVTAEGVETDSQLQLLKKFNCDLLQGFYFSMPVNEQNFLEKIKTFREK